MWTGPDPDWSRKVTGGVISNPPKLIWTRKCLQKKKDRQKSIITIIILNGMKLLHFRSTLLEQFWVLILL